MQQELTGFLLINKQAGVSSFHCVQQIKRVLPKKTKIGHTGTLDNFATGLLIVCIGRGATRLVDSLMNLDKQYEVTAKLGELTDTLDNTGTVLKEEVVHQVTREDLQRAIDALGTGYVQTPPIYSALKHQGEPLYALARQQKVALYELEKIVAQKQRTVTLHKIELISLDLPFFTFKAHVSKGTYIRSLANDIAAQLGTCATTHELCRTAIGNVTLALSHTLSELNTQESVLKYLISIEEMRAHLNATAETTQFSE